LLQYGTATLRCIHDIQCADFLFSEISLISHTGIDLTVQSIFCGSMSSFKKEGAARNPKKQTRLLDAYGNFGEHEPLVLPNDPDRSAVGDLPQLDSLHASYGAARNRETTATGVTYHGNVPDHSVRSFFRHLNFVIPSRFDVVEITASGTETMLSYRHIGEARDLPPSAPGMRRLQFRRSARRRMFLFLTEPETSKASALFFFILVITITLMNIVMMM
jgi:hypothetical protein